MKGTAGLFLLGITSVILLIFGFSGSANAHVDGTKGRLILADNLGVTIGPGGVEVGREHPDTDLDLGEAGNIDQRIERQHRQIEHNLRRGRITDDQADALNDNLRRIRGWYERAEERGTLDRDKIAWYNHMLDRNHRMLESSESREIFRLW